MAFASAPRRIAACAWPAFVETRCRGQRTRGRPIATLAPPTGVVRCANQTAEEARLVKCRGEASVPTSRRYPRSMTGRHRQIVASTLTETEAVSLSCGNEAEGHWMVIELVEACAVDHDGTLAGRSTVEAFESALGGVVDGSAQEDR